MKTVTVQGKELDLTHTQHITAGYGHKKISVELCYIGCYETFSATTNNMPAFDAANDIDDLDERRNAFYEIIAEEIEDQIIEWINSL